MKAPLSPFLSLMKEKEAKENQGIRDACQVSRVLQTRQREAEEVVRVLQTRQRDSCQVACIRPYFVGGRSRLDLLLLSFLLSREEKKEPVGLCLFPKGDKYGHSDSIIRSSRIVWGAYAIRPYRQGWRLVFLSPFLSLMKEKEAKENQGVRDASQIYRVP